MKTSTGQVEQLAEITHLFPATGPAKRGQAKGSPKIKAKPKSAKTRTRGARVRPSERKRASDQQRANDVCTALAELQEAMDMAIRSGLEVELTLRQVSGRFADIGSQAESLVGEVKIFRQLV